MFEEKKPTTTSIANLGEFGLIEKIKASFTLQHPTSIKGIGDDAAVLDHGNSPLFIVEQKIDEMIAASLDG